MSRNSALVAYGFILLFIVSSALIVKHRDEKKQEMRWALVVMRAFELASAPALTCGICNREGIGECIHILCPICGCISDISEELFQGQCCGDERYHENGGTE